MLKKIFLILVLFFSFSSLSFAIGTITPTQVYTRDSLEDTDLSSKSFKIDTSLFSPGGTSMKGTTAKQTIKNSLLAIIEKLILSIGAVALLIMTIGAGYMIIYHGEDSLLTRGKNIFNAGLIAIVLALSAEIIVKLVAYLLY